jgi:hypothetical protein
MGLVRNLKKTLSNLAEKILVELSYHYITQRAKQTLEKPANSSKTMSSQNRLTAENLHSTIATSLEGFTEKTIMMETTEDIVAYVREWSIERTENKNISKEDASAILAEFYEWIEPNDDEISILSLEPYN